MNATLINIIITGAPAIIAAITAALWSRRSAALAREKMRAEIEERQAKIRTVDTSSIVAVSDSMAVLAKQMADTSFSYIDRLHADSRHVQEQLADMKTGYEAQIKELQNQIVVLTNELRTIKSVVENGVRET